MNTTDLVHYVSTGERPRPAPTRPAATVPYQELIAPLRIGIARAREFLRGQQRADGSWRGQVHSDPAVAAQWILLMAYLGREHGKLVEHAARSIIDEQLPGGGWSRIPGGAAEVTTSVQAYFALKLAGFDASDERLTKARAVIRSLGGADAADATTRFLLALFAQIKYDCCPVVAPESLLLLHNRRGALAPLAVLWSHRPVRDVGLASGVRELFVDRPADWPVQPVAGVPRIVSATLRRCEHLGWTPFRRRALDLAEAALIEQTRPGTLTRISFPKLMLLMVALDTLGRGPGNEPFDACDRRLQELAVDDDDSDWARPQLHTTPLADTALVLRAAAAGGISLSHLAGRGIAAWLARCGSDVRHDASAEAAWLLHVLHLASDAAQEASHESDGALPPSIRVRGEFAAPPPLAARAALGRRAGRIARQIISDLVQRQNSDGGWAPTAGGPSDSAPDLTGAVLMALAGEPGCPRHRIGERLGGAICRAAEYLRAAQRADGSWGSATGVEFIHGTSLAIGGLMAAGVPADDSAVAAGINWLLVHQHPTGGWGESTSGSSSRPEKAEYVASRPSASQTAWALLALIAAGLSGENAARRAVQFLLDTQDDAGNWREPHFTLRDPHSCRWYRNDLHATAWPLLALARWAVAAAECETSDHFALRLVAAD